jgi:hypothetical protein
MSNASGHDNKYLNFWGVSKRALQL